MINKVSKREYESSLANIDSEVAKLVKILFKTKGVTHDVWVEKVLNHLRKIDGIVYRVTLCEDVISTNESLKRKASMMREKVYRIVENIGNNDDFNYIIANESKNIFDSYCKNIKNFLKDKIEVVDEIKEKIEDNYKTFDDKAK